MGKHANKNVKVGKMMSSKQIIPFQIAEKKIVPVLKKLSTERLIIWIVGKSNEVKKKLSLEEIVIECWLINPEKHSMRGFNQFPDSHTVQKRIGEMKGKKGLLSGSEMSGYILTELSKVTYANLKTLINLNKVQQKKGAAVADRTISSIDEAPYKRLRKTPAYIKYLEHRENEIVETDFLYFYGINWHSKKSLIESRIKNTDLVVKIFSRQDEVLKSTHSLLNQKFKKIIDDLLKRN
jgi:hypothetical protein